MVELHNFHSREEASGGISRRYTLRRSIPRRIRNCASTYVWFQRIERARTFFRRDNRRNRGIRSHTKKREDGGYVRVSTSARGRHGEQMKRDADRESARSQAVERFEMRLSRRCRAIIPTTITTKSSFAAGERTATKIRVDRTDPRRARRALEWPTSERNVPYVSISRVSRLRYRERARNFRRNTLIYF